MRVLDGGRDAAVGGDGGSDLGAVDAGQDGGGVRDAGADAGTAFSATIDGVIAPGEWDAANVVMTSVASEWGVGNTLRAMYAVLDADGLWVAIDGQVDSGNALVVYVDDGEGDGVGVADLSSLTDSTGVLDDAVSAGIAQPTGFAADWAFGAATMSHTSTTDFDDVLGWRDVVTSGADFHWVSGAIAPAACGASACETLVPRATLGGPAAPRTVALFARIVNHDGTLSPNQCLPDDDATMPRVVTMVLALHE